jgi:hypothetical protein
VLAQTLRNWWEVQLRKKCEQNGVSTPKAVMTGLRQRLDAFNAAADSTVRAFLGVDLQTNE